MPTYMLTWNPRQGRPANLSEGEQTITQGQLYRDSWSVGNRKHLSIGSRVFLIRQGMPPKGVVASGYTTSEPQPINDPDDHSNYCGITFTMVLRGEGADILPLEDLLRNQELNYVNWSSQRGGIQFTDEQAEELERLWRAYLGKTGKVELTH